MITTLLFDFSRVLLHPKDKTYIDSLNGFYREIKDNPTFSFFDHFELNEELLQYLESVKRHVSLNIFTSDDTLQNAPEVKKRIKGLFEQVFSANALGISKKDHMAYLSIAASLHAAPEEILFIDDTQENLEYAQQAGLQTFQYTSNNKLLEKLHSLV